MGMGCGANYVDYVDEDFVEKTCPKEYKALMQAIKKVKNDFVLSDLAQAIGYHNDLSSVPASVCEAFDDLVDRFGDKTGLSLDLTYHDSASDGDRYDDIDGVIWSVGGVYTKTKAGKKYDSKIKRGFFVTFG